MEDLYACSINYYVNDELKNGIFVVGYLEYYIDKYKNNKPKKFDIRIPYSKTWLNSFTVMNFLRDYYDEVQKTSNKVKCEFVVSDFWNSDSTKSISVYSSDFKVDFGSLHYGYEEYCNVDENPYCHFILENWKIKRK